MREKLEKLALLQLTQDRITLALSSLDSERASVSGLTRGAEGLIAERNAVQDRFEAAKRSWQELENAQHSRKEDVRKWEERLKTLQDWREHQTLAQAIKDAGRAMERTSRDISERFDEVAALEAEYNELQEQLEVAEVERDEAVAALGIKQCEVEASLSEENASVAELLSAIGGNEAKRFQGLQGRGLKDPVVKASKGVCGACNIRLRPQSWVEVQQRKTVIYCQSCQRIMLHPTIFKTATALAEA